MQTDVELMTDGMPVNVYKNSSWLAGSIISVDAPRGQVRVSYQTKNGNRRECTMSLPGDADAIQVKRGSTFMGTGVTGQRFRRDAPRHECIRCKVVKAARSFPTLDSEWRLGECRECRDERTPSGHKSYKSVA